MADSAASSDKLRQDKATLRKATLARREALDEATRSLHSRAITQKLVARPDYRRATVVAAYSSFGSEYDTSGFLLRVLADGKRLILPRIDRAERALQLRQVHNLDSDLVAGVWGIREPGSQCPVVLPAEIDFMLVPGVAFTQAGARLGYGGGFYDRLMPLLARQVPRIAAAFGVQVVDSLPEGPQDRRVDAVITEA
ncbi:MAG TPA: 5-formyltetrahydrofolate cyclo-ligase [Burkholderiales bacterium]|nr:5-formyltetrahydrofolate cyclo-ligase [Burkholderiales bacterium]